MVWVVSGSFQMWMQMCCLLPPDHLYLQWDRCMLHVLAGSWHCAGNAAPWFLIYSYLRNRSINYTELYMVVFTRSRCRWGGLWAAANPRMMSLINFVGMRLTANYDKVDIKNLWPLRWTCKAMRPWQGGHQEFVAFAADLQCPHGVRVSACMLLEVHDACMLLEASTCIARWLKQIG